MRFGWVLLSALCLGLLGQPAAADNLSPAERIAHFTSWWAGSFSNERQALAEAAAGGALMPEAPVVRRDLRIYPLTAPAIGAPVLFLVETRADAPTTANRQRVMTFRWLADSQEIQVEQLFVTPNLAYDQPPINPADLLTRTRESFTRVPPCDLFFTWDSQRQRYKGGMRPRACTYEHPVSGPVYAEFDMILTEKALWYRDRSLMQKDGAVRGEIAGFSWLRFDRLAQLPDLGGGDRISKAAMLARMTALGRMEGIWEGTFRRYDASGNLIDKLPSHIEVRYLPDGATYDYEQVNILKPAGRPEQRILSQGKWDVDRLRFGNDRLDGYSQDLASDPSGLSAVVMMTYKDGSKQTVSEIVTLSPDGQRRSRATQYFRDGILERRTLIDEVKISGP